MEKTSLEAVFTSLPSPYLILKADKDFTIVGFNDIYLKVTQTPADILLHKPLFEAFPVNPKETDTSGKSELQASLETVVATKAAHQMSPIKYDIPIRNTDKYEERYWVPLNSPVLGADGEVEFIINTVQDITEKVLAEREVKTTQQRYAIIAQATNDIIWDWDIITDRVYWNTAAKLILGYDDFEIIDTREGWLSAIHPDDVDRVRTKLDIFLAGPGQNWSDEYHFRCADGSYIYCFDRGSLLRDEDGKPARMIGSMLNMTERRQMEKELINAKELAIKSNLAKSQFLSMMSHEIRTPLNGVIGVSHLLLMTDPRPDQVENLNILKFSAENLLVIINDILDFNKIDAGKIDFEQVDFSIKEVLNNVQLALTYKAEEKGLKLRLMLDNELKDGVIGDPVRMSQVLINLVSNAIKFTTQGTVTIEATQQAETKDTSTILFCVTDTGIGIATENIHRIFESFAQASTDTTRKFGGTGLGLAITKRLLQLQGSNIEVKSVPGQGSAFSFTLTFKKSALKFSEPSATDIAIKRNPSLKGTKVLLVEDNSVNVRVARQFLQLWDIEMDVAENGRVAYDKVKEKDYHMILMDLQMPEMDGYEATQKIRLLPEDKYRKLPIIALTASAMLEIQDQAFEVGMNDYLSKPFNPNELYRKISKYAPKV